MKNRIKNIPEEEMWKMDLFLEDDELLYQDKWGNVFFQDQVNELPKDKIKELGIKEFFK